MPVEVAGRWRRWSKFQSSLSVLRIHPRAGCVYRLPCDGQMCERRERRDASASVRGRDVRNLSPTPARQGQSEHAVPIAPRTCLDGLRCRRGGQQVMFEGQTSYGDEPGDPSPLPRLPRSGRHRAAPGGLITSDRNLVRARRDYRLFERSLDGHACSWGCAFSGVAGVQRSGRPAPWSSFGRSAKAAPHTAVGRTEDSACGAHRDPRLTGGSHAESRCPLDWTRR